ncbi:MAG: hypothetical protein QOH74_1878 [Gaiellales bacterium]|nr:hypothetical protein [Gaiellales bacterium]
MRFRPDDRWLFLTPEVEREVPVLLERLDEGRAEYEQMRIERMIHHGTIAGWFAYLRDCRQRLEHAATARPDDEALARLAAVLREQYLLVPALRDEDPLDETEQRRLEELAWTSA